MNSDSDGADEDRKTVCTLSMLPRRYRESKRLWLEVVPYQPRCPQVRGPLQDVPIEKIHRHFKDFVSPSNIFLIPKSISGLGEVPHFIEAMARFRDRP